MKWDKYTIDTTTEAEDFISMMLKMALKELKSKTMCH